MHPKILAVLAVSLLAGACSRADAALRYGPAELDHSRLKPVKLSGRVLARGDYLGLPGRIGASGTRLLVLDGASDSVIHILSAADGHRLRSMGRRGEGPGEYRTAWSIAPDPRHAERFWVYDIALGRLTRVDLDSITPAEPEMIRVTGDGLAMQPVWLSDSLLASPGLSPRGRLSFFGKDGGFRGSAGPLPSAAGDIPPQVLQHAWTGSLVANPRRGLLALLTQHADQLELYRADGSLVRKVRGPFGFDPRFTVETAQGQPTMGSGDDMRFGYTGAGAAGDRIYALFSGRTREGYGPDSSFGRFIHVYDWAGALVRVLELDTPILSIAISPDERWVYGIRHDPEPAVMAFPLAP
jgi:hypothetical protein